MWSSARVRLPQGEGEKPLRLTQGPQRACLRSGLGPSLGRLILTITPWSTHIMPRTGAFISLHIHPAPQDVEMYRPLSRRRDAQTTNGGCYRFSIGLSEGDREYLHVAKF